MTSTQRKGVLNTVGVPIAVALLLAVNGCLGTTSATLTTTSPRLVLVSPGVYVVEGQDSAMFYSNDYYWRYSGGVWYRSGYYNSGFARVRIGVVPGHIRRVERPSIYVRYRGGANARVLRRARHSDRKREVRGKHRNNKRVKHNDNRVKYKDAKRKDKRKHKRKNKRDHD